MSKIKKQTKKVSTPKKVQEPIGTRIAKAVFGAKKISERIFGYISYDIKFVRAVYHGKTQRPAKITALEKGIVGILLVDETASFEKIGSILGLDVVNDKAEQSILRSAIETLRGFNAIEGDDSLIALTEGGHAYADKGERPDTYTKDFDIFVDTSHPTWYNKHKMYISLRIDIFWKAQHGMKAMKLLTKCMFVLCKMLPIAKMLELLYMMKIQRA